VVNCARALFKDEAPTRNGIYGRVIELEADAVKERNLNGLAPPKDSMRGTKICKRTERGT